MPRRLRFLGPLALALVAVPPAGAEEISFDELLPANDNAPVLSEEYAHLGVHFVATDDGSLWSGLSAGDPGGWELEGSNGTAFLGFNGRSYALGVSFDAPVRNLQLDVARASGSLAGDSFVLRGYRAGALVEQVSVVLGEINQWSTVALAEEVDGLDWVGLGASAWYPMHPFGVDNLRWGGEAEEPQEPPQPEVLAVAIDVKPGSTRNPVNPFALGVIPVAVLGGDGFDVAQVDAATLAFGPEGAPSVQTAVEDANGDGHPDLVSLHRVAQTGIALGDTEACLSGATLDGAPLAGCDAIATVPGAAAAKVGRKAVESSGAR